MSRSTIPEPDRLQFGVTQPITIEQPGEYDWHCWRREPHGDIWLGFFKDDVTAVKWAQTQHEDIVVNNVPPPTSRRYITGGYQWGDLAAEGTFVPHERRREQPLPPRPVRVAKTTAKRRGPTTSPFSSPPRRPVPAAKAQPTAEEKALRASAAKRHDTLKADEARDIASGKEEVH